MSTYSTNLYIELIGTGEQTGTWGSTTNSNFQYVFEEAIVGRATVAFSDADVTLTPVAATTNQTFRNLYLNCTGTNTASRNLIVPTINKNYIVENNTTGGFDIVVKTAAGTGITVPNGYKCAVYVDGTNVVTAFNYLGGTTTFSNLSVTGTLTVAGVTTLCRWGVAHHPTTHRARATCNATSCAPKRARKSRRKDASHHASEYARSCLTGDDKKNFNRTHVGCARNHRA